MSNLIDLSTRLRKHDQEYSLNAYLELVKSDASIIASPAERMLKSIGDPKIIQTSTDPKLSRLFFNKPIRVYEAFADFYGMENVIEKIVSYFRHSAQGLEEKKQILYLLGGVGSAKSSIAERLKTLMEKQPIYVLKFNNELSPIYESPLGLFDRVNADKLNIPERYLTEKLSPWALKRLQEANGDISKFSVVKMFPSQAYQIALSKTEPGDENNQDISALVGKTDIRKLAKFSQQDTDSYSYSGGLCLANQGMLEFVEMFKAPIKVLHPLLTATQEGKYKGTESIGEIPFDGIIMAHSNESEWATFKNNKNNEAFIDRISVIKVPYSLRESEEVKIYQKLLRDSALDKAPCAPTTLNLLAKFSVMSRLKSINDIELVTKLKVYDGLDVKSQDIKAKSYHEYKEAAGVDEGMSGISTRFAFKILSKVYNYDPDEIGADPVRLLAVLEESIINEQFPKDLEDCYLSIVRNYLTSEHLKDIEKTIQTAYLETYDSYGQNIFDRYIQYADFWLQDQDYRDDLTGEILDRAGLNKELEELEKSAGIANPKDFRSEVVNFVLRARLHHKDGKFPWKSYEKMKEAVEKVMFNKTGELLPVITFNAKKTNEEKEKHSKFVERMTKQGYTPKQVETEVRWFIKRNKDL